MLHAAGKLVYVRPSNIRHDEPPSPYCVGRDWWRRRMSAIFHPVPASAKTVSAIFAIATVALSVQRSKMPRKIARDLGMLESEGNVGFEVTQFAAAVIAHARKLMRQYAFFRQQCSDAIG